jgi:RNase H-like domain found in reverse transcriptase
MLLAHLSERTELALIVDALADQVGAALHQRTSTRAAWQPLGFFSKKLEPAQTRYSVFDHQLLACVQGICHFRYMLEARPFTIYTFTRSRSHGLHTRSATSATWRNSARTSGMWLV